MRVDLVRCVLLSEDKRTRWEGWGRTEAAARKTAHAIRRRTGHKGDVTESFEELNVPEPREAR